ncbi:MAG: peptidoglycan DD-metalloendopeptidase family protein [Anaerolineae bacterium]
MNMEFRQVPRRRFGTHLLLVVVALVLAFVSQIDWGEDPSPTPSSNNLTEPLLSSEETAAAGEGLATPMPTPHVTVLAGHTSSSPYHVINDLSLAPVLNPHTYQVKPPHHKFKTYVVERGDTPVKIADKFGISPETLLGGNPWLSQESNRLQAGSELVILPMDGVLHEVRPGETLEEIAAQYDVPVEDMIAYEPNNLEFPYRLQPGTKLLVPGAEIAVFYWTAPKTVASSGGSGRPKPITNFGVVGTGVFSWPVGGHCITQYYWYGHPAIDLALPEGTAVRAADTGTVTYASWAAGTYYDYGNLIVINHGNGYETLYAHLSNIGVYPGQVVEKGQWIGATGDTGRSSGPHLHFEVRFNDIRYDPLSYLSGPIQDCTG